MPESILQWINLTILLVRLFVSFKQRDALSKKTLLEYLQDLLKMGADHTRCSQGHQKFTPESVIKEPNQIASMKL